MKELAKRVFVCVNAVSGKCDVTDDVESFQIWRTVLIKC
jgi:hypothetical protein